MTKKNFYIFLIVALILTLSSISKKDNKIFEIDGVKYAVSVNNNEENEFPNIASYDVEIQCTNSESKWNYEKWIAEIYNITGEVLCDISFTSKDKVNLNSHIKDTLTSTTQGIGEVVNENGYRYEGKNPNNYIKFNNELWRIIGVFDETSHGQTGEYLTKIIRNDILSGYVWDKNNKNNWATSSLYNLLNIYYYNADDGTNSEYCYKYSTTGMGECDFNNGGINDTYRPMVKNVTWYLGGYSTAGATPANMYKYERSISNTYYYSGNRSYKTTTGYIGLMYASDYGYSVLESSCARTTNISVYDNDACAGNSWLFITAYEKTITHRTAESTYVIGFDLKGNLNYEIARSSYPFRPVLYLDSSVYILKGDGSEANPYVIGM